MGFHKKKRNKKINDEILEKHIKKNRDLRYGRNLKRRSNQLLNSRNTKPEIKVQKVLEKKNIYFLKHIKTLAGTPDIIIPH